MSDLTGSPWLTPFKFWSAFILVLAAGGIWIYASVVEDQEALSASPYPGFLAPDFTLQTLGGDEITLSELRDQVVVVNLWASWCGPCRAEMPAMQEIYDKSKGEFEILAVNMTYQDDETAAAGFVRELGLTFPILLDHHGDVGPVYQLEALPTTFFIDKNGVVVEVVPGGPMTPSLIESKIESLLRRDGP